MKHYSIIILLSQFRASLKVTACMSFIGLVILGITGGIGYAQKAQAWTPSVRTYLAAYTPDSVRFSYSKIKSAPYLLADGPACKVDSYFVSVFVKGMDIIGPFAVWGNEITDSLLMIVKRIEDQHYDAKLFFEEIGVTCGSNRLAGAPIVGKICKEPR